MNKIFKVIWSKTKNAYVAVSELAKSNTKSGSKTEYRRVALRAVAVLLVMASMGFSNNVIAIEPKGTIPTYEDYALFATPLKADDIKWILDKTTGKFYKVGYSINRDDNRFFQNVEIKEDGEKKQVFAVAPNDNQFYKSKFENKVYYTTEKIYDIHGKELKKDWTGVYYQNSEKGNDTVGGFEVKPIEDVNGGNLIFDGNTKYYFNQQGFIPKASHEKRYDHGMSGDYDIDGNPCYNVPYEDTNIKIYKKPGTNYDDTIKAFATNDKRSNVYMATGTAINKVNAEMYMAFSNGYTDVKKDDGMIQEIDGQWINGQFNFITTENKDLEYDDTLGRFLYKGQIVPLSNLYTVKENGKVKVGVYVVGDKKKQLYTGNVYGKNNEVLKTSWDEKNGYRSFWAVEVVDPSITMKDMPISMYNSHMDKIFENDRALHEEDIKQIRLDSNNANGGTIALERYNSFDEATGLPTDKADVAGSINLKVLNSKNGNDARLEFSNTYKKPKTDRNNKVILDKSTKKPLWETTTSSFTVPLGSKVEVNKFNSLNTAEEASTMTVNGKNYYFSIPLSVNNGTLPGSNNDYGDKSFNFKSNNLLIKNNKNAYDIALNNRIVLGGGPDGQNKTQGVRIDIDGDKGLLDIGVVDDKLSNSAVSNDSSIERQKSGVLIDGLNRRVYDRTAKVNKDLKSQIAFGANVETSGSNAVAFGEKTKALNTNTFAAGIENIVDGENAAAFGNGNRASGKSSFAIGHKNKAEGLMSAALGVHSTAKGTGSLTWGGICQLEKEDLEELEYYKSILEKEKIEALNNNQPILVGNTAQGMYSTAFGTGTYAKGINSMAFGLSTLAEGNDSIAFGDRTRAKGEGSVSFGHKTEASGNNSIAFGYNSTAKGEGSIAWGDYLIIKKEDIEKDEGYKTLLTNEELKYIEKHNKIQKGSNASGKHSVAFGVASTSKGDYSLAHGFISEANGLGSVAFGFDTRANGNLSMAFGDGSIANGGNSVAFGYSSEANGKNAVAFGTFSKAEGNDTISFGNGSNAKGDNSLAGLGGYTLKEAQNSISLGDNSVAEFKDSIAIGTNAVANRNSGKVGYVPNKMNLVNEDHVWKATDAALAIGDDAGLVNKNNVRKYTTRQIIGLAAGTNDTDAVNVAQLKANSVDIELEENENNLSLNSKDNIETGRIYNIALNKDLDLNKATFSDAKTSDKSEIGAGYAKVANVELKDNLITGLGNTKWDEKNIKEDRVATEGQLSSFMQKWTAIITDENNKESRVVVDNENQPITFKSGENSKKAANIVIAPDVKDGKNIGFVFKTSDKVVHKVVESDKVISDKLQIGGQYKVIDDEKNDLYKNIDNSNKIIGLANTKWKITDSYDKDKATLADYAPSRAATEGQLYDIWNSGINIKTEKGYKESDNQASEIRRKNYHIGEVVSIYGDSVYDEAKDKLIKKGNIWTELTEDAIKIKLSATPNFEALKIKDIEIKDNLITNLKNDTIKDTNFGEGNRKSYAASEGQLLEVYNKAKLHNTIAQYGDDTKVTKNKNDNEGVEYTIDVTDMRVQRAEISYATPAANDDRTKPVTGHHGNKGTIKLFFNGKTTMDNTNVGEYSVEVPVEDLYTVYGQFLNKGVKIKDKGVEKNVDGIKFTRNDGSTYTVPLVQVNESGETSSIGDTYVTQKIYNDGITKVKNIIDGIELNLYDEDNEHFSLNKDTKKIKFNGGKNINTRISDKEHNILDISLANKPKFTYKNDEDKTVRQLIINDAMDGETDNNYGGTITGLANTKWDGNHIKDDRVATEGQLKEFLHEFNVKVNNSNEDKITINKDSDLSLVGEKNIAVNITDKDIVFKTTDNVEHTSVKADSMKVKNQLVIGDEISGFEDSYGAVKVLGKNTEKIAKINGEYTNSNTIIGLQYIPFKDFKFKNHDLTFADDKEKERVATQGQLLDVYNAPIILKTDSYLTVQDGYDIDELENENDKKIPLLLDTELNINGDENIKTISGKKVSESKRYLEFAINKNMKLDSVNLNKGDLILNKDGIVFNPAEYDSDGNVINREPKIVLNKDGLSNGGKRITNIANATEATDAVNLQQLQDYTKQVATSHTNLKVDDNLTLKTDKQNDGLVEYSLGLNKKITLNGKDKNKIEINADEGYLLINNLKFGQQMVPNHSSGNFITGLDNTNWVPSEIIANRAATEGQLKEAIESNINKLDNSYAKKDASNITEVDVDKWGEVLGEGKIVDNDNKLVSGKTIYEETRLKEHVDGDKINYHYVQTDKSAADNIKSLDDAIFDVSSQINENKDNIANNQQAITNLNKKVDNKIEEVKNEIEKVETDLTSKINENTSKIDANTEKLKEVEALASQHTVVTSSDKNITVSEIEKENSGKTYDIKLSDNLVLGTDKEKRINIDSNNGEITVGEKTKLENGVAIIDDVVIKNNQIDGLTNISFGDKTGLNGREHIAATEGQLRNAYNDSKRYIEEKVQKVEKYVTKDGLNANDKKITNVADAVDDTDAVNLGQVKQLTTNVSGAMEKVDNHISLIDGRVNNIDAKVNKIDGKVGKAGAGAAALAALHPMEFDEDDKLSFAVGTGRYSGKTAASLGMFYRPNENTLFTVGSTMGNGEDMVNMGVSFNVGKGINKTKTRYEMQEELNALNRIVKSQEAKLNQQEQKISEQDEKINNLIELVNSLVNK